MQVEPLGLLRFADGRPLTAGSGLLVDAGGLWVLGDDLLHLGRFSAAGQPGRRLRLLPGRLPQEPKARKRAKPDFEMLLRWRGGLLALGSGSLPARQQAVWLAQPEAPPQLFSLAALYARLTEQLGTLNFEGAFVAGGQLTLLQRGNAGGLGNVQVQLPATVLDTLRAGRPLAPGLRIRLQPMALGALDGVPLGFTDGCALPGGHWLFSAAAEDTGDAIADGACRGSVIGRVDRSGQLLQCHRLPGRLKVEGLAAQRWPDGRIQLAMVCDADDPLQPSPLLRAWWP